MKKIIILITAILLLLNIALGLIIEAYQSSNMYLNCGVILLSGIVLYVVNTINLKDAFKYSLTTIFGFVGFVEYILGFFAPSELTNNWFAILVIVVFAIEIIILLLTNYITTKN